MITNNSAHQLIRNKDGLFLDAYDPATPAVFEWVTDPASAWVFHPLNSKGKEMLLRVKLSGDITATLIDRADAIKNFSAK